MLWLLKRRHRWRLLLATSWKAKGEWAIIQEAEKTAVVVKDIVKTVEQKAVDARVNFHEFAGQLDVALDILGERQADPVIIAQARSFHAPPSVVIANSPAITPGQD